MQNLIPEIVIFSAAKSRYNDDQNEKRHEVLLTILKDLGVRFLQCKGTYKGRHERSVMIFLDHAKGFTEHMFTQLATTKFDQECILHRDKYKQGFLMYKNGVFEKIGTVNQITPVQATELESYTWFPLTDTYLGVANESK